ncbi:hypothetical protein M9H77_31531 [Catharanthus roseus]|uniref:Uncharacterized protein n=1 Tax=Catharanthus roseus TaxID=4058 RepID=A0ACC0A2E5_CATRO|nr:hypothetical protein M9H77_31531 [Catharanthus roseus]
MGPGIIHDQDKACIGGQDEISQGPTEGRGGSCRHDAPMPNDLQLMATISGGLSHSQLYGDGSEAAHLKAESSRAAVGLPPCYLETEQWIMRRVEAIVSIVRAAFDDHMRRFAEQSHLSSAPMPLMMDIVKAAMTAIPLTSSSTAVATGTLDARVSSSTPLPPSIDALGTITVDPFSAAPSPLLVL